MKQISTLFTIGFLSIISFTTKAQITQNFEGTESTLTGGCWTLSQVYKTTAPGDIITGTGSLYTNPPTSGSGTRDILTPALNITSTSFTVSFKYKVSSKISGNATRTIEVGLLDVNGSFTSLSLISLDKNSPVTVLNFNQTFTLASTGIRKLVLRLGGDTGDGNSRLILDDLYESAAAFYGPASTCNSAPIAVNDMFTATMGLPFYGNVLTNDNEPNGETMTPSLIITSIDGTVVLNSNGTFSFTPNALFAGTSTTFTYQSTDNGFAPLLSNIATVTINFASGSLLLPIKLISFDAKYNKPNVTLNWSTAQERNFSHFIIEFSTDGIVFNQEAIVFGAGESNTKKDYTYVDKSLEIKSGLVYYRLSSVDQDNKASYSPVRSILLGEENKIMAITTYPNPVGNELKVTLPRNWQGKEAKIELFNTNGQLVKAKSIALTSPIEALNTNDLGRGFYVIRITSGAEKAQFKVIKN